MFLNCSISVLVLIQARVILAMASSNSSFLYDRCKLKRSTVIYHMSLNKCPRDDAFQEVQEAHLGQSLGNK